MKNILISILMTLGIVGNINAKVETITDLNKYDVIIDVRTVEEFATGHLRDAKNIPVDEIIAISELKLDKTKPILVYCRSGRRSELAKTALENLGYTQVTNGGAYKDLVALDDKK